MHEVRKKRGDVFEDKSHDLHGQHQIPEYLEYDIHYDFDCSSDIV